MESEKKSIRNFFRTHKRIPTYREMQDLLGYASKGSVAYCVGKLIDEGFLKRSAGKIVQGDSFLAVHVLGTVAAGFPTNADEDVSNLLTLDELLIDNKESTYMLSVKGDSMKDAGILEGDMVLIERKQHAREGSIVVAEIDGEYTLKYLRKQNGAMYLEPANKKYKPMYPTQDLRIQGIVIAVIRKY